MSVLEKIVKAEKEASALLVKSRENADEIIKIAHEEIDALKLSKAREISTQLNVYREDSNHEIATFSKTIVHEKEKVIAAISASSRTRKQKIVEDIFKDITTL